MTRAPQGRRPAIVLAAHGTRSPDGPPVLDQVGAALADAAGVEVRLAFVDVIGPTVGEALDGLAGPVVVLPAFLAAGYHVRTDLPRQLRTCGRGDAVVAAALGPDPRLVDALLDRLAEAGGQAGDTVVLAAAGSSDARALADVRKAADALAARLEGEPVLGYAASASPTVPEAVAAARRAGASRVAIASWLLAPGLFQHRLTGAGADAVAGPLGAHPAVVDALLDRYRAALQGS